MGILARCAVRFFIFHPAVSSAQVLDVGALGWSDPSRQPHAQGRGAKKRTQRAGRLDRATRSNFKPYGGARSQGHDTGLRGLAGCTPSAPTSPLRASSYRPVALPVPRNLCSRVPVPTICCVLCARRLRECSSAEEQSRGLSGRERAAIKQKVACFVRPKGRRFDQLGHLLRNLLPTN